MAKKIAITNHKGGVGKTMTTFNLGAALALKGKRVLLVDGDGQCNLTMVCAPELPDDTPNFSSYLNDDDIEIKPYEISENLFLIPGSSKLDEDAHNIELSIEEDEKGATHYVADVLGRVDKDFDFILIDSAPGSGVMLVNIIIAADQLLVPIADKFSIVGAKKLTQIIRANNKKIEGHYLLTKLTKFGVSRQIKELLMSSSPESLYHATIRQCEDLNKAASSCQSIFEFAPKSRGAEDYSELATEIIGGTKDSDMPF